MRRIFTVIILFLAVFKFYASGVRAQITSSGIGQSIPVNDSEAEDGSIICTYAQNNIRCNKAYDTAIYGVISDSPAVDINDKDLKDTRLVVTSGVTVVRVSSVGGNIAEGDFLTTSEKPGVGQKAVNNGYVVGKALEAYQSDDSNSVGRIQVLIGIHPESQLAGVRGNLLQFIRQGLAVPIFQPLESLRYLLAVIMVLISFTLGMIYFGRSTRAGIEAIGRNPLAKRVIQLTVFMNIVLTIVIVIVGLGIAYMILIL